MCNSVISDAHTRNSRIIFVYMITTYSKFVQTCYMYSRVFLRTTDDEDVLDKEYDSYRTRTSEDYKFYLIFERPRTSRTRTRTGTRTARRSTSCGGLLETVRIVYLSIYKSMLHTVWYIYLSHFPKKPWPNPK